MKFIKDNWFCMLMFVAVVVIIAIHVIRINKYDKEIQERDDRIEEVLGWNDQLLLELEDKMDENDSIETTNSVYADSIDNLVKARTLMKRKYEKQISDITSIPVDSKYREVTGWLDSR